MFNLPSSPVSTDAGTDSDTESLGEIGFCGIFPRIGCAGPSSPAITDSGTESRGEIGFCGIFPRTGFAGPSSPASTGSDTESGLSGGMKKLVVKVDLHDHRAKYKAMRAVSGFEGIRSLAMDMKDKKLMVCGDFDPVKVVNKLRKSWHTEIVNVGSAKADEGKKNEDLMKAYQACYSLQHAYYYLPSDGETEGCVIC